MAHPDAAGFRDLDRIRNQLFYGLSKYTKSFPDFTVNEKFAMVGPRHSNALFDEINASLADEEEYLLYIHLPFCHLECTFCNAAPRKTNGDQQRRYLTDLLKEIDLYGEAGAFEGRKLRAIFFGGGTPTIYKNEALGQILDKVRSHVTFADACDITCEAHPEGLVGNTRVAELKALGITRISCGSQSFDPKVLELCDRKSHRAQVAEVVGIARDVGLSINIDMMIGLPGQTVENVRADLEILEGMMPSSVEYMRHEIVNPLMMNVLARDASLIVPDDELFAMVIETSAWMEKHGYERNGSFAHERFFPFRYHWLHEVPFLGVGARSRSYMKHLCFDTHEDLEIYHSMIERRKLPVARVMRLDPLEQMYRSVFLRLQLAKGLDVAEFTARFGVSPTDTFPALFDLLEECGCIEVGDEAIKLTRAGSFFVEDVCCAVLDDAVKQRGYSTTARRLPHAAGAKSLRVFQG